MDDYNALLLDYVKETTSQGSPKVLSPKHVVNVHPESGVDYTSIMDQNQRSWQASPSPSRSSYRRELTSVVLCKKETGALNLHHPCCVTPKRVVSLHAGLLLALLRLWVARLLFMNDL